MRPEARASLAAWACIGLGVAMLVRPLDSDAGEARLSQWQSRYQNQPPFSQSANNARCALCHSAKADVDVNKKVQWNSYGYALRQNGSNFTAVEQTNSDGDPAGRTNSQEIAAGTQPGWRAGSNNPIYESSTTAPVGYVLAPPGIGNLDPQAPPTCTLSASNLSPAVGTTTTLTASCSNSPTTYTWTGCVSTAASCVATRATQGSVTYGVTATNSGGTSSRASVTVNWQPTLAGSPGLNRHGLTGSWYDPSTNGQGVEIEVYQDLIAPGIGFLQGAWFTYDHVTSGGAASQRWYTFSGNVRTGQSSETLTIYRNIGGNFNTLPVTSAVPVGSVVLSVTDCTHATMAYSFTDGSGRSGTIAMVRLLPNVTCSMGGMNPTNPDFGYSGNWYDSATSGQGILMELNPNQPFAFFAWYTYAPDGQARGESGQRWYTGQASYSPGARTLPMTLYETTGGLFDSGAPTPNTVPVGTATATFTSCNSLRLNFAFTGGSSAGASGTINLTRVGPSPAGCGP